MATKSQEAGKEFLRRFVSLALWVPVGIAISDNFAPRVVEGRSMEPTLSDADYIFINSWFYTPKRGDVVTLKSPLDPDRRIVKRLIAMEGDVVLASDNQAYSIPAGKCWIEGDNRHSSRDSNEYGPIPVALVEGCAVYRVNGFRLASIESAVPPGRILNEKEQQLT